MNQAQQLAARIQEVFIDGSWIANTNFKDALVDIELEQAQQKVQELNTIALLTFHINYYLAGVLNVFVNGRLDIKDQFSFDAPELSSEADWKQLKETLNANAKKLNTVVVKLTDQQLNTHFIKEEYGTFHRNIDALIEHSYYHLGQIILLKKMVI